MLLLDLALQGVRGFSPRARIAFRPGVNVGRLAEPGRRRALIDLIYHSLYPDPSRAGSTAKLADPGAKESRVALTFFGRDQASYRIMRDVVTGAVSLHKFDASANKFMTLTRVSHEVAQYVRVQHRLPNEVDYERLFVFSPDTMPSRGARAKTRSGAAIAAGARGMASPWSPHDSGAWPASPGMGTTPPQRGGIGSALNLTNALVKSEIETAMDPAALSIEEGEASDVLIDKKSLLRKLREEADHAERAERAQAELDQLHARKFELTKGLDRVRDLRQAVEKLRTVSNEEADLRELPRGFGERLKNYEEAQAKHRADRQKLIEERDEVEGVLRESPVPALVSDRYFVAGILFAVLFVLVAEVWEKPGIALVNLLALAVSAGAAFRWVGDLEARARLEARLVSIGEREQRLERQFDLDTAVMRRLMQARSVTDPRELLERIEVSAKVEQQLRAAEDSLRAALQDPALSDADRELTEVNRRIEACEAEIVGTQGASSADTLHRRISQVEREVARLEARRPRAPQSAVEEDEEDGYGHGYGGSQSNRGSGPGDPDSEAMACPAVEREVRGVLAMGFGDGGTGGEGGGRGTRGGYDAEESARQPNRSRDLVQTAIDLLQIPVDDIPDRVGDRFRETLSQITDGAFEGVTFGPRGEVSVVPRGGGEPISFVDLRAPEIDVVDSALRLSLLEACVASLKVPVLVDDPHPELSAGRRALFTDMVARIGAATQVLFLTDGEDVRGHMLAW